MAKKKAAQPATENAAPEAPAPEYPGLVLALPGAPPTPHVVHPHDQFELGTDVQFELSLEPIRIEELGLSLEQAQAMHLDANCPVAIVAMKAPPAPESDEQAGETEKE